MTDQELIRKVAAVAGATTAIIEDFVGEFSQDNKGDMLTAITGFWAHIEDENHPRRDGQLWKTLVAKELGGNG